MLGCVPHQRQGVNQRDVALSVGDRGLIGGLPRAPMPVVMVRFDFAILEMKHIAEEVKTRKSEYPLAFRHDSSLPRLPPHVHHKPRTIQLIKCKIAIQLMIRGPILSFEMT
jgi:hypothetical protein